MENFPEERFNRRRFLKSGLTQINRAGVSQAFSQTTWGNAQGNSIEKRASSTKSDKSSKRHSVQIRLS